MDKLVILTGPTAVGKTDISIKLAKTINGEIISADSIQVYKHMDIGSAKIRPDEMQGVRHHLIDILEPTEDFNVSSFKSMAKNAIGDIYSRGRIPILVGGTGFYIQAVIRDVDFTENEDDGYRKELEKTYKEKGSDYLYKMLLEQDEEAAKSIHPNNVKRVIRALEFKHQTGQNISEHNKNEKSKASPYNYAYFVLNQNREVLYDRIEKRIDAMLSEGLVDEVRALVEDHGLTSDNVSMQGLGYKEIYSYLKGECTLDEAIYVLKRDTRHFAKRQLTWFKGQNDVIWIDKDIIKTEQEQLEYMLKELNARGII